VGIGVDWMDVEAGWVKLVDAICGQELALGRSGSVSDRVSALHT
jgi:hypothetical protein